MDTSKLEGLIEPLQTEEPVHIIGCGAVGSTLAINLARLNVSNFTLWDFDEVQPHNLTNQQFEHDQIGQQKTLALRENILKINPHAKIRLRNKYTSEPLSGHIFIAPDSIEVRKAILNNNRRNPKVKGFYDTRIGLYSAQTYSATLENADKLLETMNFTDEEARKNIITSPCGTSLSVICTIQAICAMSITNYIKNLKGEKLPLVIMLNIYTNALSTV